VVRIDSTLAQYYLRTDSGATGNRFADDLYSFALDDVSLTVTPASRENSEETTGLRVDGLDTLNQTLSNITSSSGEIRFYFTPRHNFTQADLFGITQPVIFEAYGDSDDYIKLYRENDTTLTAQAQFSGTLVQANWTDPILTNGTIYLFELSYGNNNLILEVNGTQRATQSGVTLFSTTPTQAYYGSDSSGLNQYGGTFSGIESSSLNVSQSSLSRFGIYSAKLASTGSLDLEYTTSISPSSTSTHTFTAFAYTNGSQVTEEDVQLYFNSENVSTTYVNEGGGWWRITSVLVPTASGQTFGVQVKAGKTVYVDGFQLEEKSNSTSYCDGSLGSGYSWSGAVHNSSSSRESTELSYLSSGNIDNSSGSVSLWVKPNWDGDDGLEMFYLNFSKL